MGVNRLHNSCGVLLGKIVRKTSDSGHVSVGGRWSTPVSRLLLAVPDEAVEGLCSALEQTARSNAAVQCGYDKQKALFD
jgi:hypothetical protein